MIELETYIGDGDENVAAQRTWPSRADIQVGPCQIAVCAAIFQMPLIVEVWIIGGCRIRILVLVGAAHYRITGHNAVLLGQVLRRINGCAAIGSLENKKI